MTREQAPAVVELYWRWWMVPAADHERAPGDNRPAMDDRGALVHPVDPQRPTLAA